MQKLRKSLTFNIINSIVLLLVIFSVIVSVIGYYNFTESFKREYTQTTYRIAQTAASLVNGNHLSRYLENGGDDAEYRITKERMDILCNKMDVTLLYVIQVDTTDYGRFVSIFNAVNAQNTKYTPWELGYKRDTTNDEYRRVYEDLYTNRKSYGTVMRLKDLNGAEPHITSLIPIRNDLRQVTGILCIQRPMSELKNGGKPYLRSVALATFVLAVLSSVTAALYTRRQFIRPVVQIKDEAERFARENKQAEIIGSKKISKITELDTLAGAIHKMETDTLQYIDNLTAVTAEKKRIGTELQVARLIQEGSVPSIFPAYPDRTEFDIFADMTPAKEVGGDFYDFFLIDDDHLAVVMADVSGKGIPAALFMMVTKILLNERACAGGTPGEILTYLNNRICQNNKADMFVTIWLGILEISTGKMITANAGHDDPALCRKDGDFALVQSKHGLVIGAMDGMRYKDFEILLHPGDKLFLYTDGIPEATDADGNMFTLERMLHALDAGKKQHPQAILQVMRENVDAFVGDAPQFDDMTMLCLEIKE